MFFNLCEYDECDDFNINTSDDGLCPNANVNKSFFLHFGSLKEKVD